MTGKVQEELVFPGNSDVRVHTFLQTLTCSAKRPFLCVTFEDCAKTTADVLESKTVPLSHVQRQIGDPEL